MARNISANALAKLETDLGTEPIVVVEVEWSGSAAREYYADKESSGIAGRILEISGLNEAVQISGSGNAQEVTAELDDTDGRLKSIYDTVDVHKKTVRIWQWFQGLDFADRFLIFKGQINSPVTWNEGKRTLRFSVVNRIEDVEIGFSAEEGAFVQLPEDLIGKPWPLCFGTVVNVPALKAVPAVSGTLARGVGIKDFTLSRRIAAINDVTCGGTPSGFRVTQDPITYSLTIYPVIKTDTSCLQQKCLEKERLTVQLSEQRDYEYRQFVVFGGEKFEQGKRITLNINGGLFTGQFQGNVFTCEGRKHPLDDGNGNVIEDTTVTEIRSQCTSSSDNTISVGNDYGAWASQQSWERYREIPAANFFWAAGGATVTMADNNEITYIANILPSTILRVAAWRTVNGNRFLLTVPPSYYGIRQTDYTGYQVMEIVLQRPLSAEDQDTDGGWEDDLYITLTSSVGPNTVDIIEWLIETYTDYGTDATSFAATKTLVDNYPMHFPLLTRKNLLAALQELANQSRCAIWLKDDTFFIRYLSTEPESPVDTIEESDILPESLEISLSRTEELTTEYVARWRKDYAIDKPNTLILRHNVKPYGTQRREYDYYAFNILDYVRKTATFWLIRQSNTWRKVTFSTRLSKLNLEAFDAVTLDLPDLCDDPVTCIIEKATYDSERRRLDFEVWAPIKSGARVPYDFAWPADVQEQALFPTIEERELGLAGSGREPNFSTIAPNGHPLGVRSTSSGFQGFNLTCNGDAQPVGYGEASDSGQCRQDHGDNKPSDSGDEKKEPDATGDDTGDINAGSSPISGANGNSFYTALAAMQEKLNQAARDAAKGKSTANSGASGAGGSHSGQDLPPDDQKGAFEDLPTEDELPEDECKVVVVTAYFKTKGITVGGQSVCVPDGPTVTEKWIFNSQAAAEAFKQAMDNASNCSAFPTDNGCKVCFAVQIIKTGCEPPEDEEPGLIGYEGDAMHPDADPATAMVG